MRVMVLAGNSVLVHDLFLYIGLDRKWQCFFSIISYSQLVGVIWSQCSLYWSMYYY